MIDNNDIASIDTEYFDIKEKGPTLSSYNRETPDITGIYWNGYITASSPSRFTINTTLETPITLKRADRAFLPVANI